MLMTADTIGGVWQYALELIRGLDSAGVDVILATLGHKPSVQQQLEAQTISSLTLHSSDYKLEWMPGCWEDVHESGRWLLELEDAYAPDLIHLNTFCHAALPWQAPVLVVAHSCVVSWWESVKGSALPPEWWRYRCEVENGLHAADLVVAPSDSMAAAARRLYGVTSVRTIPNGRVAPVESARITVKHPMVLAAGRVWDEAKNLAALDRACVGLRWPLYLAGETRGPSDESFRPHSGIALGALSSPELVAWMQRASIYALPARYEPFGLSVLEAALCGCALVLGDIPSLRENWNGAAVFVAPTDERALHEAIAELIESAVIRERLARAAVERAAQFPAHRTVAQYLDSYAFLLDATPASHAGAAASA